MHSPPHADGTSPSETGVACPHCTARAVRDGPRLNQPPTGGFVDVSFENMAQITLDAIGDAVLVVDPKGKVIYLNKVAETMTGWSREEAFGRPVEQVFFVFDGATRERAPSPAERAISENRTVELALGSVLICRDGTDMAIEDSAAPIHDRHGKTAGAVIVFHDARQSGTVIQQMSHHAQHDFLTGLPNRMLLVERLTQAIGMSRRRGKKTALLFLDLNRFKQINDEFGHATGDHLLQYVAEEIGSCVRATDTICRYGGDEFVILLPEIDEIQDAAQVAEKVLSRFTRPHTVNGQELQVALSIGIAVHPENGPDAETLMLNADTAMYASKETGQSSYRFCQGTGQKPCWQPHAFATFNDRFPRQTQ
ncbi:diguanylate cyclase [Marinobacter sp. 71-i]|uniref:Diguanylate cyclase n=1 Tax=Marinobacter iranensis TaxID=2962607 RepID=A0ABT5YAQ9_9GAMM|nr:diguanylate cyclase [Marinobacter iranensis]MDF0750763.1 diguanylate cyclase [Marinobacter iranensis]